MIQPLLVVQGLVAGDGEPLSCQLEPGEILQIEGRNGSGKTVLLRTLLGHLQPRGGTYTMTYGLAACGYVPQLVPRTYALPLTLGDALVLLSEQSFKSACPKALATGLIRVGELGKAWNTASGGERQRLLIAAELLRRPKLLFLDEPLNHLDVWSRQALAAALLAFVAPGEQGVVMVSHGTLPFSSPPRLRSLRLGEEA